LAEKLEVSPRNITTLVDGLVETGFVRRIDHPTDRRAVLVVLTKKGEETYARLQSEMTRFATLLFGKVTEKDLRTFGQILQHVGGILSGLARRNSHTGRK
jgi:DNA-binding MarR family transcriptional regulator